ncbi:hypothetical protein DPMN_127751 [Dreissena polymorpha]|uniref:Uncharacterized protein n=1 Tax=Dreissena polymorpha TaxID=45954 RepID=A0A9D4H1T8_DREPO|nr:hypothetical protein DPMN_127751 [Dreissena polymorpha]
MIGQKLKTAPPTGGHVFQLIRTTFELNQDIINTNILTNFELGRDFIRDFIWTKLLIKFHEDGTRNVASRVFTSKSQDIIRTNVLTKITSLPPGGHVFQQTETIFELIQDIIKTNILTNFHVLTKFHEDWIINVTFIVLTRKNAPPLAFHDDQTEIRKKGPAPWWPCFSTDQNHLIQYMKNSPPPDFVWKNLRIKFHDNRTIKLASIVKNSPSHASNVFQTIRNHFELVKDVICTNLLTKFYKDRTINVAFRVFTRQMLAPHKARRTIGKRRSQKLPISTLCSEKKI